MTDQSREHAWHQIKKPGLGVPAGLLKRNERKYYADDLIRGLSSAPITCLRTPFDALSHRWRRVRFQSIIICPIEFAYDLFWIRPGQDVCPLLERDRSIRAIVKSDARDAQHSRFILDSSRIREHNLCLRHQTKKIQITKLWNQSDSHPRIPRLWTLHTMINKIIA